MIVLTICYIETQTQMTHTLRCPKEYEEYFQSKPIGKGKPAMQATCSSNAVGYHTILINLATGLQK
jgi:hypothetical protein